MIFGTFSQQEMKQNISQNQTKSHPGKGFLFQVCAHRQFCGQRLQAGQQSSKERIPINPGKGRTENDIRWQYTDDNYHYEKKGQIDYYRLKQTN